VSNFPKPDEKEFPLSDREKIMWYMFTLYLPKESMYHRNDEKFQIFRMQQTPDMAMDEFKQIVNDMATMERNYLNKGKAKHQTPVIKKFCHKCERVVMTREDGTCMMCGEQT